MKSQIPTILAIFILVGSLIAVLVVKNQVQLLKSNASASFAPERLKITNIKDTSFTVSWITNVPTTSFIEYNSPQGQNKTIPTNLSSIHFVTIQNLNPNTTYSFKINSGGSFFDNNSSDWVIQTLNTNPDLNTKGEIISGKVVANNNLPAKNALVYVEIPGNLFFSSQVSGSGNWLVSLPPLADTTILQITIEDISGISSGKVDLKNANPVPTITLGNPFDFTHNTSGSSSSDIPKVQITLP